MHFEHANNRSFLTRLHTRERKKQTLNRANRKLVKKMAPFKLTEVSKTNKSSITESFNDRCLCNTFGADGRLAKCQKLLISKITNETKRCNLRRQRIHIKSHGIS